MRSSRGTLVILLYHGVTQGSNKGVANFSGKHIDIRCFEDQISLIQKKYTLLSMDDVVEIYTSGEPWPKNAVAVTFDDGFQNNYLNAAPILDKYNCPSTFYVCAGMINTDLMFWVDIIEDCLNRTKRKAVRIHLDEDVLLDVRDDDKKIQAIDTIKKYCKKAATSVKDRILDELVEETDVSPSADASSDYKMMSWKQLKAINNDDLFTVGGHTLYHDIMAAQPVDLMEKDLDTTLSLLEYNLGTPIAHFSYPEGQAHNYSQEVISALRNKGIVCSPSAIDGFNTEENLFNLKRIMPNFMGREFPLS